MRVRFEIFKSYRAKSVLAVLTALVGFGIGLLVNRAMEPKARKPTPVKQLIRELAKQDTRFYAMKARMWPFVPGPVRRHCRWLEPVSAATVKWRAAQEIGSWGSTASAAVPALMIALSDPDTDVQVSVVQALESIGPPARDALPNLIRLIEQSATNRTAAKVSSLRATIALAVAAIAPDHPASMDVLRDLLKEATRNGFGSWTAVCAARGLDKMANATNDAVPILIAALRESDVTLRHEIIQIFARILVQRPKVVAALIEVLEEGDLQSQGEALWALGSIGSDAALAVPHLLKRYREMRNNPGDPRWNRSVPIPARVSVGEVVQTLGRIGPGAAEAIPLLVEDYSTRTNQYWFVAAIARWQIDGATPEVLPVLLDGLKERNLGIRRTIVRALCKMDGSALPAIVEALQDDNLDIRLTILKALPNMNLETETRLAILEQHLTDTDPAMFFTAIRSLGQMGPVAKASVPRLETLLNEQPNDSVRLRIERALQRIKPKAAAQQTTNRSR